MAKPLRIAYSFAFTLGDPGIGTTALHQVRGLIERGHEVTVCCTSLSAPLEGAARIVTTLTLAGRRIPHRALGGLNAFRYHDFRVARTVARGSFDIVHCWPRATLATARAARERGAKVVREAPNTHTAHAYETVARELETLGLPPARGHSHAGDARILALEEAEFRTADLVLAPSEFVRQTFLERGFEPDRLALHQYGCDVSRFAGPRQPSGDGRLTALFVGRCEPRKGLHYALDAWLASGAAEHGRLVICGSFYPGYRELLRDRLAHPSVEVAGFVPDPAPLMRASDVLLAPSIEEGSALVTYEAQAAGCVLLASDAAGARCEHLVHGLIHPARDVETLTEHVRMVDRDRDLLERLRSASVARREELDWARAAEVLEGVYLDLLSR